MAQTRNRTDGLIEQIISEQELENCVISWILYGVEGIILTITNFPIVLVVFLFAKLRQQKEFVIIAALAFADGVNGLAYLLAAAGRLLMVSQGRAFVLVTRWECFMTPWILLWVWSQPAGVLMLVVISLDRILAVSMPFRYFSFTARYAYSLVAFAYSIVLIPMIWSMVDTYMVEPLDDVPAYCFVGHNFIPADHPYYSKFLLFGTLTSVLLYPPVLLRLKITLSKNPVINHTVKYETLKRATLALGLSSFATFVFYILPMAVINLQLFTNLNVFFLMLNLNAMVNIFIYIARFKDIRKGVKALVTCRFKVTWGAVPYIPNRVHPVASPNKNEHSPNKDDHEPDLKLAEGR